MLYLPSETMLASLLPDGAFVLSISLTYIFRLARESASLDPFDMPNDIV